MGLHCLRCCGRISTWQRGCEAPPAVLDRPVIVLEAQQAGRLKTVKVDRVFLATEARY